MDCITYDRVLILCREKGITIAELERSASIGSGTIGRWKKSAPSAETLIKVSAYFNVSTDYLLGCTDVKASISDILGDPAIVSIQRARESLSTRDKDRMMVMLRAGFHTAFGEEDD